MSPVTHLFISWSLGSVFKSNRKERILVTVAGVIPDIDGIGLVYDLLVNNAEQPLQLWGRFHHVLGHNFAFGLLFALFSFSLAIRCWVTAGVVLLSFHIHLLCDLLGSKGPDGYQWPIPYLLPFSDSWQLVWGSQWQLNDGPNFMITGAAICFVFYQTWKNGISPLEIISLKANGVFVETLRSRFGNPGCPK